MANAGQHTIEIIFAGVDKFSDKLGSISDGLNSFGSGMGDIAAPFADMAKDVLLLQSAIGTALVGAIGAADQAAVDFRQKMNDINVIGNFTPEIFDKLKVQALDAFESIKSTDFDGYMNALNQTVAFGVQDLAGINSVIAEAESLSIAGAAKLDETVVGLLGTMNAYGASAEEITRYSGAFFQITQDGNASIAELSTKLSGVTSLAAGAGVPIETLGAAIAAMTAAGTPTAEAITKIKASLEGIINPTESARKLAADLGIEFGSAALKSKGYEGVLKEIYEKTGGNVDVMLKLITTSEGVQAAMLLGKDAAGNFAKSLNNMKDTSEAVAGGLERAQDKIDGSTQGMANAFKLMMIQIGQEVEGQSANVIAPFTTLFKNIAKSVDTGSLDEVFGKVKEYGDDIRKYLTGMAEAAPEALEKANFEKILAAYERLIDAGKGLFSGIDLSTPEGLTKALQSAIDTGASLADTTAGIVEAFQPMIAAVGKAIEVYNSLDTEGKELIGNLGGIATQVTAGASGLAIFANILSGSGGIISGIKLLGAAGGTAAIALGGVGAAITSILYFMNPKAKAQIDDMAQGFIGWADSLIDWTDTHNEAGESADQVAEKMIAEAKAMRDTRLAADAMEDSLKTLTDSKYLIDVKYDMLSLPEQTEQISKALDDLTAEKTTLEIRLKDSTGEEKEKIMQRLKEIDSAASALSDKETQIQIDLDTRSAEEILNDPAGYFYKGDPPVVKIDAKAETAPAKQQFEEFLYSVGGKEFAMKIAISPESKEKTKEDLEKIVPPEKQIEIMAKLDIANIEAETEKFKALQETAQASFEWEAKLNIAEVEANVQILDKSMENINTMFTESSSLISDAFGLLGGLDFSSAGAIDIFRLVKEQIREQNDLQKEALGLQKEITQSQIKLNEAKQKALLMGKPMFEITVDGTGLQTHLESILYSIMQFAQEKATMEGLESLLGA